MKAKTVLGIGAALGAVAVGTLGVIAFRNIDPDFSSSPLEPPKQPWEPSYDLDLPTRSELEDPNSDLDSNWGTTPENLRPLFMRMEEISTIKGAGRIFSLIAYGEARWNPEARNNRDNEVAASRNAIKNRASKNPKLAYETEAAEWGSGGLFGALAPYFLWIGVTEVGKRAPFLNDHPSEMYSPRKSAFFGMYYLQRLLRFYDIRDHLDIKAGWAGLTLLTENGRKSERYDTATRAFSQHAQAVGIDLRDESTIPKQLTVADWPGALDAYERIRP